MFWKQWNGLVKQPNEYIYGNVVLHEIVFTEKLSIYCANQIIDHKDIDKFVQWDQWLED